MTTQNENENIFSIITSNDLITVSKAHDAINSVCNNLNDMAQRICKDLQKQLAEVEDERNKWKDMSKTFEESLATAYKNFLRVEKERDTARLECDAMVNTIIQDFQKVKSDWSKCEAMEKIDATDYLITRLLTKFPAASDYADRMKRYEDALTRITRYDSDNSFSEDYNFVVKVAKDALNPKDSK